MEITGYNSQSWSRMILILYEAPFFSKKEWSSRRREIFRDYSMYHIDLSEGPRDLVREILSL